jgi:hypothetical protein
VDPTPGLTVRLTDISLSDPKERRRWNRPSRFIQITDPDPERLTGEPRNREEPPALPVIRSIKRVFLDSDEGVDEGVFFVWRKGAYVLADLGLAHTCPGCPRFGYYYCQTFWRFKAIGQNLGGGSGWFRAENSGSRGSFILFPPGRSQSSEQSLQKPEGHDYSTDAIFQPRRIALIQRGPLTPPRAGTPHVS